jgi:hypothetical protein
MAEPQNGVPRGGAPRNGEEDARFEDAADRPLRLLAESVEDLKVIATLAQDAVGKVGDGVWMKGRRRFVLQMNRFRWEDKAAAERARRPYERVRSALTLENVTGVRARGVDAFDREAVWSLLAIAFDPGEDGAGDVRLLLSDGAEIAVSVEALEARLVDLTRPWEARGAPRHEPVEPGAS